MSRVNLLPWRIARRQRRQREFLSILGAVAVGAILLVGLGDFIAKQYVNRQEARNDLLRAEIASLDVKIREIRDLQAQKAKLQARMDVIQELQIRRPMAVRLFDALARSTPEGVFITSFGQAEQSLSLQGWAQSNARVSSYMHDLDASDEFDPSTLRVVRAGEHRAMHASQFELQVPQHVVKSEQK